MRRLPGPRSLKETGEEGGETGGGVLYTQELRWRKIVSGFGGCSSEVEGRVGR